MYADENKGFGPAIGQPYAAMPNWALVVQTASGRDGSTSGELYSTVSALVCPAAEAFYRAGMTRTYAMNATGHAGLTRPDGRVDPDNYDLGPNTSPSGPLARINFDAVVRPSDTAVLMDSAVDVPATGDAPPPTRTASMIDFRQPPHVALRLGRFHPRKQFNFAAFDGSARPIDAPLSHWVDPLP